MGEAKDYRDENLTDQERVENLLEQMSLEEKVSQLSFQAREIRWLGIPAYNWWNEALHGVARGRSGNGISPGHRDGRFL